LGAGDSANTKIPTMKSKEIAEMTTNFTLGDFMIYPGLTGNSLIGKRKSAARDHSSYVLAKLQSLITPAR
jgi:hypothetical protein